MGITYSIKTKKKESLKLLNKINSFLFEQEYNELKNASLVQNKLKEAVRELSNFINK